MRQWIVEKERLAAHLACVAEMHKRVELGDMSPERPTHFKRGSWDRIVLMSVRNDLGLPLFVDGDCEEDDREPPDLLNQQRPPRHRLFPQHGWRPFDSSRDGETALDYDD